MVACRVLCSTGIPLLQEAVRVICELDVIGIGVVYQGSKHYRQEEQGEHRFQAMQEAFEASSRRPRVSVLQWLQEQCMRIYLAVLILVLKGPDAADLDISQIYKGWAQIVDHLGCWKHHPLAGLQQH